ERAEDVQFGGARFGFVQVVEVRAFPEEALAGRVFNALRVDAPSIERRLLSGPEVFADHRNHAYLREEAGRERKVGCRAAKTAFPPSGGGFNRIERNAADYSNGHSYLPFQ